MTTGYDDDGNHDDDDDGNHDDDDDGNHDDDNDDHDDNNGVDQSSIIMVFLLIILRLLGSSNDVPDYLRLAMI